MELIDLQEDMIRITDRLPTEGEYRSVRHLILQAPSEKISDDELAHVLASCPHLETVILSGVPDTTDRTIVLLAENAINLQGLNLAGCTQVTDVGVLGVMNKSPPLQWLQLNGVVGLTDPTISAIAKTCSRLIELELCDLPLLTPVSVRDIWSFSRKLRTLRLAHCPLLTDKAFPAPLTSQLPPVDPGGEKPLPHRPITWLEGLPPLILHHSADSLRHLDVTGCKNLTDEGMEGIVSHGSRIQTLILAGCSQLTDRGIESVCRLGDHLDTLILAHVGNITDRSIVRLARSCANIRCIDVAFCRHLTDLSVIELASLGSLRRLSLMRVHKLTDNAVFALAEHATGLERLHLSYCDCLSLDALHLLLKRLENLQHFAATGVRSFIKRKGIERFSEVPPPNSDGDQQAAFRVFVGENIGRLRRFLDKEEKRKREAEARSIPFIPRSDDSTELY